MRTSPSQFQLLVDFMQINGDLSRPSDGSHGKARNFHLWMELANSLNADATGDTKNIEKWRKVWSDLKNNTKKKSARIYKETNRTGGGPACNLKLTDLEQRVLDIIGTRAATGIVEIPEVGLEDGVRPETTPLQPETHHQPTEVSPSLLLLHEMVIETSSNVEDWNQPGMSAQPCVFPPPRVARIQDSPDRNATSTTQAEDPAARVTRSALGARQQVSPTPFPATPRRQRRRSDHRRTRTQTQSDLARQAFVRSDCEWRNFQQEAERDRIRLRESELRMQERWLDLFEQFLALGNRIVDTFEKNKD